MGKKLNIPIQICYLGLAGLMAIAALFSLLRGNIPYLLRGIVYLAATLFFALHTSKDKLIFGGRLTPISDSLSDVVKGNPIVGFLTGIDSMLAWIFIAVNAYYNLYFYMIISKIPVINLVGSVIDSVSSVLYYTFLISLVSLFAKKQYARITTLTGVYTAVMACGFIISFVQAIFSSNLTSFFYSNIIDILFFGYLFALFNEYQGMENEDMSSEAL
ncbi:MAG: hypothetical protein KBA53_04060 [Thermoclostridium sp.]|nr:hypothetical protein [Thermoclostridium sp.]